MARRSGSSRAPPFAVAFCLKGKPMAVALISKTRNFVTEVSDELKKVTWPDFPQLKSATGVIIVFVIIVAVIIWVMDLVVRGIMGVIMDLFAR
jgi:preprotein translocase subunit SecE